MALLNSTLRYKINHDNAIISHRLEKHDRVRYAEFAYD